MELDFLEIAYHISGILAGIFLTGIVILLFKKNKDVVRTSIFLKYKQFRTAFLAASMGSIIFIIGNLTGLISHNTLAIFHDFGEIIYNISIFIFAILIFQIIREKKRNV
jgi:hypothetical protein